MFSKKSHMIGNLSISTWWHKIYSYLHVSMYLRVTACARGLIVPSRCCLF